MVFICQSINQVPWWGRSSQYRHRLVTFRLLLFQSPYQRWNVTVGRSVARVSWLRPMQAH